MLDGISSGCAPRDSLGGRQGREEDSALLGFWAMGSPPQMGPPRQSAGVPSPKYSFAKAPRTRAQTKPGGVQGSGLGAVGTTSSAPGYGRAPDDPRGETRQFNTPEEIAARLERLRKRQRDAEGDEHDTGTTGHHQQPFPSPRQPVLSSSPSTGISMSAPLAVRAKTDSEASVESPTRVSVKDLARVLEQSNSRHPSLHHLRVAHQSGQTLAARPLVGIQARPSPRLEPYPEPRGHGSRAPLVQRDHLAVRRCSCLRLGVAHLCQWLCLTLLISLYVNIVGL